MEYELTFPYGYTKQPLPGRDEWITALRSGEYKQAKGVLQYTHYAATGPGETWRSYCCLGVVSKLQGALREGGDTWDPIEGAEGSGCARDLLSTENPLHYYLKPDGTFPDGVYITVHPEDRTKRYLAGCNDSGLSFTQIADIIEAIWYNDGPLPKREICSQ